MGEEVEELGVAAKSAKVAKNFSPKNSESLSLCVEI